jgi:protease-4
MIWREIKLAAKEKPFIVSMGEVAASGGYYISCPADVIVAEPSTLAGSIGVYGMIPNTKDFFNNKTGITFDRVQTGKNSLISLAAPLTNQQKILFQQQVDDIYYDFVNRVSEGRKMTFEQVDEIAQGRIWSGIDAKRIGLVDTLGGLDLALKIASENAKITDYKIVEYPTQKEAFEKIMEMFSSEIKSSISDFTFEQPLNQIIKIKEALKHTGIQARLPFEYVID